MNKIIGIIAWILSLGLSMVIMFCLAPKYTTAYWVALGFIVVAFLSSLIFQLLIWRKPVSKEERFLHMPAITVTYIYMFLQLIVAVVFSLCAAVVSVKITVLINAILLIIAWVVVFASLAMNDHIKKADSRQKDHHRGL